MKIELKKLFKKKLSKINLDEMSEHFTSLSNDKIAEKKAGYGSCSDLGNMREGSDFIKRENPFKQSSGRSQQQVGFGDPNKWHYTFEHPSQSPLNTAPRGFNSNGFQLNLNKGTQRLVEGVLLHQLYNENKVFWQDSKSPKKEESIPLQYKPYNPK